MEALRAWNAKHQAPTKSEEESELEVQQHLRSIWEAKQRAELSREPTLATIPRFFFKATAPLVQPDSLADERTAAPSATSLARHELLATARQRLLERKASQLIDTEQLEKLWLLLSERISRASPPDSEPRISYESFLEVAAEMPASVRDNYMRASHFLKFPMGGSACIAITPYFQWVMRRRAYLSSMLELRMFDGAGSGKLSEAMLESFLANQLPVLPALEGLQKDFIPFYLCTAVRKFFFFLDPKRRGHVRIRDVLASPILTELHELRREALGEDEVKNNWFSQQTALSVYGEYLQLDTDQNGMLSRSELAHYGGGGLTRPFIENLFQECQTYDGEIDYKTYLDFVLASWYKKTSESLAYFFRLLDVKKNGALSAFEINFFFRAIVQGSREAGQEPVVLEDVRDEIFDMVKPVDALRITLDDLLACKVGDTIVSMLTDVHGFWAYDNRETLMHTDK